MYIIVLKQYIIKTWYAFLKSFDLEQGVRFVWSRKIGSSFKGDLTFLITLWVEWLRTQALESNINDLNSGSATSNCVIWDKWFKCFMSQFSLVAWLLPTYWVFSPRFVWNVKWHYALEWLVNFLSLVGDLSMWWR